MFLTRSTTTSKLICNVLVMQMVLRNVFWEIPGLPPFKSVVFNDFMTFYAWVLPYFMPFWDEFYDI